MPISVTQPPQRRMVGADEKAMLADLRGDTRKRDRRDATFNTIPRLDSDTQQIQRDGGCGTRTRRLVHVMLDKFGDTSCGGR